MQISVKGRLANGYILYVGKVTSFANAQKSLPTFSILPDWFFPRAKLFLFLVHDVEDVEMKKIQEFGFRIRMVERSPQQQQHSHQPAPAILFPLLPPPQMSGLDFFVKTCKTKLY